MVRLSMNEMTTYRWPFEQDVAFYEQVGLQSIGVWRQKLSDYGDEDGIDLLFRSGLHVSNLYWAGGFTGSDGRTFRESLEDAEDALRLAAAMEADCLVVYSGARNGHTRKHCRRIVKSALKELVPLAVALEVTLALKPMHAGCAEGWTFLTDLGETLDLLADIDSPQAKLAFDTYHLCHKQAAVDGIPDLVSHIGIVCLGDAKRPPEGEQNRCRLGEGRLPLQEIVDALMDCGYSGYFDVKLVGEDVETASYGQIVHHSKRFFEAMIQGRVSSSRTSPCSTTSAAVSNVRQR